MRSGEGYECEKKHVAICFFLYGCVVISVCPYSPYVHVVLRETILKRVRLRKQIRIEHDAVRPRVRVQELIRPERDAVGPRIRVQE